MPRSANVLAVDDTPANLLALEAVLGNEYTILRATSGAEALEILDARHDIDLILMDVQMPGLDGFETAALIKQRETARDIPLVFVTAVYREDPWIRRGYEVGGIDYFSKPFDPELLRLKIGIYATLKQRADFLRERERQLRISEELLATGHTLSSLFESLPAGVITLDSGGGIDEIDDEACRIFGLPHGSERFVNDRLAGFLRALDEGPLPYRELVQIRRLDGAARLILCSASRSRKKDGTPAGAVIVLHDVTECRKIEDDFEQRIAQLLSVNAELQP